MQLLDKEAENEDKMHQWTSDLADAYRRVAALREETNVIQSVFHNMETQERNRQLRFLCQIYEQRMAFIERHVTRY